MKKDLRLIVLNSAKELGAKVNKYLVDKSKDVEDFRVPIEETRFSNGEGKIKLLESVREKDIYVIGDIGNYDETYKMHGRTNYMGPDEHYTDIKRVIAATSGHAKQVSLIMPLLYESRQDRRKGRESLDCAIGLQELENLGVKNLITFDAHNPSVNNSIPTMAFESFYPTNNILKVLYKKEKVNDIYEKLYVIAPDFGAAERARYYSNMIGCDFGIFYKRRDYSKVINGQNPIVEHRFLGKDIEGKYVIIVDDMIASGSSILEVARDAKEKGATKVFMCATFALFTEGIEKIEDAYNKGIFDYIYSTNLSYVPQEIKDKNWYVDVDCSTLIGKIINELNEGHSLEQFHQPNHTIYKKLRKK